MKRILKLALISMFSLVLVACSGDNRAEYIEQLEELNRNDLAALENWLAENDENLSEYFNITRRYVDVVGEALDYASQVSGLDSEFFHSWDFEIEEDSEADIEDLILIFTWDYEAHVAAQMAAQIEALRTELIGSWETASVSAFSQPIGNRSVTYYLEFLEDGTTYHIGQRGSEANSIWELTSEGILLVGGVEFTAEISMEGRLLTIIDDRGRERRFERINEMPTIEEEAEVAEAPEEPEADEETNNASSSGSGTSPGVSTSSNWRTFLRDYDAWMTFAIANPNDPAVIVELGQWAERTFEIQVSLTGTDLLDFTEEVLRILARMN